jgi:arginase
MLTLIKAPTNLGLRPTAANIEPGCWAAPDVLESAGLTQRLDFAARIELERPKYSFESQPGTRIRNGYAVRRFNDALAQSVASVLRTGSEPLVIGGDCSLLLGCLAGVRAVYSCGLIHVDGHSDFYHPGNYDTTTRLGSVAGMDLALVTGRGEPLLSVYDGIDGALIADHLVVQIGERENRDPDYAFPDIFETKICQLDIFKTLELGVERTVQDALATLSSQRIDRLWLHVDLDVLDQRIMPAVDSPGQPGLDFGQLASLTDSISQSGRLIGVDVTIYDPDLDPDHRFAQPIVDCLVTGLQRWKPGGIASPRSVSSQQ